MNPTTISPQAGHKAAAARFLREAYDHLQMGDNPKAVPLIREAGRRLGMAGELPGPCRTLLDHIKLGKTHTFFVLDAIKSLTID